MLAEIADLHLVVQDLFSRIAVLEIARRGSRHSAAGNPPFSAAGPPSSHSPSSRFGRTPNPAAIEDDNAHESSCPTSPCPSQATHMALSALPDSDHPFLRTTTAAVPARPTQPKHIQIVSSSC